MHRIPDASAETLTDFVLDLVARGAEVHTDGWVGYNDLGRHRFRHVVTNVSASGNHQPLRHLEPRSRSSPTQRCQSDDPLETLVATIHEKT